MATNDQIMAKLEIMHSDLRATLAYTIGNTHQIHSLGAQMSEQTTELDQSVAGVQQAVTELSGRVQADTQALADARAAETQALADLAAAREDDATDDARIAELEQAAADATADVDENVSKLQGIATEIGGLAQPATPEEPPVEEPTP